MPGPATIFTTLGAVGACGAAAYVSKNNNYNQYHPSKSELIYSSNQAGGDRSNNNKISKFTTTTNKKLRIGHRNDLHVLMFVMGKD